LSCARPITSPFGVAIERRGDSEEKELRVGSKKPENLVSRRRADYTTLTQCCEYLYFCTLRRARPPPFAGRRATNTNENKNRKIKLFYVIRAVKMFPEKNENKIRAREREESWQGSCAGEAPRPGDERGLNDILRSFVLTQQSKP
jgi:hypothetical protein